MKIPLSIPENAKTRRYEIQIGSNLLVNAFNAIEKQFPGGRLAIVTDSNVQAAGHLSTLLCGDYVPQYIVKADTKGVVETKKTVEEYGKIIEFLDSEKFEKKDTLICLGGGVIGDMGGFVAGTFKRGGMTYVQIPTTTISQADSSVGGKCAVDTSISKNAVGCFYQPHLVITDVSTLQTLDERNYRTGLAESVKHGLILDKAYFSFFEENIDRILKRDLDVLEEIAYKNISIKGGVVQQDPKEDNLRKCLNLGHTVGHAVEVASDFSIYHGEAIGGPGMLAALYISKELNGFPKEDFDRARSLLVDGLGLPSKVPTGISRDVVEDRLANDKKSINGVPQFVTLDEIGSLHVTDGKYASHIPPEVLDDALEYIFN